MLGSLSMVLVSRDHTASQAAEQITNCNEVARRCTSIAPKIELDGGKLWVVCRFLTTDWSVA